MKPFTVIAADPSWHNKDQLPGKKRGASKHYKTMSVEQICALYRPATEMQRASLVMSGQSAWLADDAILFLWRLSSMQQEALDVVKAWGFTVKTEIPWVKYFPCKECNGMGKGVDQLGGRFRRWDCDACDGTGCGTPAFGMGRYTRGAHETCLVATRGKMASKIRDHSIRSVLHAPMPVGKDGRPIHSAKPPRFYTDIVEKLARGPYVELFARQRRDGWTTLGNQVPTRRRA